MKWIGDNMDKAVIFGAGSIGEKVYYLNRDKYHIIAFIDNDRNKDNTVFLGIPVYNPYKMRELEFETVIIGSLIGAKEIPQQLDTMQIKKNIDDSYVSISNNSRILFLERYGEICSRKSYRGSVAEAGVYKGEFAQHINRVFSDSTLYLFDTFEGFDERDKEKEILPSFIDCQHLSETNVSIVMDKMSNKDKVIIKKGYFPDTAEDIDDEFIFVNLDMDLYQPTMEALKFFIPKMKKGGVILCHDYFSKAFPNIMKCIDDYEMENKINYIPIGDDLSIAIMC